MKDKILRLTVQAVNPDTLETERYTTDLDNPFEFEPEEIEIEWDILEVNK